VYVREKMRRVGEGTGYAAAAVLAGVFLWAAAAKLARRDEAVRGMRALRLPAAPLLARAVPAVELALAAVLLAAPRVGGTAALVVLAAFSAVLLRAITGGVTSPCACFGTAAAEPVSSLELVRNALLGVLAACALLAPRPVVPGPADVAAVAAGMVAGRAVLSAWRLRVRPR
jgi:hypothetical protein